MGKRILVADDSPTIRKMTESLLKRQGHEVLCAEDGASALDLAKVSKPDLIFWDDSLPIVDGHGVCKELKVNDELKDTPLLILVTQDQVEKEEELKRMGADGFLVTPFDPKDILEKVEEFLGSETTQFRDEPRKEPKVEPVVGKEKPSIDTIEESFASSKKEEKADESLDILETSEFVESLEAPPGGSAAREPHGFEWFMSELKKEMEEAKQIDLDAAKESKQEIISTQITSFDRKDLKKKEKDKEELKIREMDEDQRGYQDIEKSLDQKIPSLNYDKMIQDLIEAISTKIAQEVVKKSDPEILKQIVRDEIEKLRKEKIKAN